VAAAAAQPPRPAATPTPPPAPAEPAPAASTAMDHILVVDDSDIALRFMAGNLERFGFVVHLARSGEEAIERTLQRHFAFVFMDVNMPGLDGFRTCKEIKRRRYEGHQRPPTIVMLTSRDTPIDKLRGSMAGSDAYLTKPLREAELLKVIGDREVSQHEFAETAKAEDLRF
jgi:two-component system, cell cycle response regulator